MSQTPLVSIIIPFFNAGEWLVEAIKSVLKQTYSHWEIILINDGSEKEDVHSAIGFAQKFPAKIFYVEHEGRVDKGLTFSRNTGIKHARGALIAFLDADDYWLPEKLTNQLEIFQKYSQVEAICEASYFWYNWSDTTCKNQLVLIGAPQGVYYPPALMERLYPLGEGQPPCPTGIIIKREALDRICGFEETFSGIYQLYEDQAFLSKVYSQEIVYISEAANNLYRKRTDSMSSGANDEQLYKEVRMFYLKWLQQYFTKNDNRNDYIKKLIDNFQSRLLAS